MRLYICCRRRCGSDIHIYMQPLQQVHIITCIYINNNIIPTVISSVFCCRLLSSLIFFFFYYNFLYTPRALHGVPRSTSEPCRGVYYNMSVLTSIHSTNICVRASSLALCIVDIRCKLRVFGTPSFFMLARAPYI